MEKYLEIGKIVSVQGLKGEVRVQPWCDTPSDICVHDVLFFDKGNTEVEIERSRVNKNMAVLKIAGCDTVEQAQKLRGKVLYVDRDSLELDEDTYFVADLLGITVEDLHTGHKYGVITDVTQTGANDVYHIKSDEGKMYYIPAIADVVCETDIQNGVMKITPLRGLFDED